MSAAKRAMDVLLSAAGLAAVSPVLAAAALAIKLDSAGPVFYRQQRVGRGFRPFMIYKLRTMSEDAPAGPQITAAQDPRITAAGAVLRRLKIDELPQLINVLKGEMSLVGPRPEVPRYVEMFRADYAVILRVRPGITDYASLKYRREQELLASVPDPEAHYAREILPDKIRLAKRYVERASVAEDFRLLAQTAWAVVFDR